MKNLKLNLKWLHGSPNQTGERQLRELQHGISSVSRRFLVLLITFLSLGVGNVWGDPTYNGGHIYFNPYYDDNNTVNAGYIYIVGRKRNCDNNSNGWHSALTAMTLIEHTRLYYTASLYGSDWGNTCWHGWFFLSHSSAVNSQDDEVNNNTKATWWSTYDTSYGLNSGSTYLWKATSSSTAQSVNPGSGFGYLSNSETQYKNLNHPQTVYKYTSTDNGSSYSAAGVNSGTVTISAYKMTGNGTASNTSNSATINTASTTSASKDAAYTGEVTLTASANTGYTFVGWFDVASGGSPLSTSTTYTYNAPNSTKAIYARFKNETTYAITIANSVNATTSTVNVGATPVQITAPEIAGYRFSTWNTMPSGVTKTSGNLTDQSIYISATSAATVTATYVAKTSVRLYYSNPNGWSNVYAYVYDASNTGDKNADWYGVNITTNTYINNCNTFYYYEYYKEDHPDWDVIIFNNGVTGDSAAQSADLSFDNTTNNGQFSHGVASDWTSTPGSRWALAHSIDSYNTTTHPLTCASATSGSVDVELAGNTDYDFKLVDTYTNAWYGVSSATEITYSNKGTAQTMSNTTGGCANQTMKTAGKGTYTFTWDITNKQVTITYPTSYTVTFGVGTIKGNSRTITAYEYGHSGDNAYKVNSGDYVTTGTQVQFYAGANEPADVAAAYYGWKGFYSDADATTSQLASTTAYSPYITANTTVFACFYEIDYYITPYIVGEGSISPNGANGHVATKVSFTATPGTGYKFDNWTQRSGALTIESPNNATTNVNATAASELQANFSARYAVMIRVDGSSTWCAYDAHLLTGYADGKTGATIITLDANTTYEVQIYDRQSPNAWYGGIEAQNIHYADGDAEFTIATTSSPQSVFVHSAAAGEYTFKWNLTDKKIAVHYPTSLFITSGQKTEGQDDNAGGSFTAEDNDSRDVTGGKFVADGASVTFNASPNTGYNFNGWWSDAACTSSQYTAGTGVTIDGNAMTLSSIANDKTVYAKFTPKTYTITLTRTGTGYGSGGDASATATFNQTLPAATMPTPADGYAFMGYYSAENGAGTQFIDAAGNWATAVTDTIAEGKWIKDGVATLYAYYKKAEITDITLNAGIFDPVEAGGDGWVIANPTIAPNPAGTTKICWELLYDNNNPVPEHNAVPDTDVEHPNRVKFSIAGLAAGGYKIKATLAKGNTCPPASGDILDTYEKSFQIASGYTITIQYKDDAGNTIATSTTTPGMATEWKEISVSTIIGYQFSKWKAGDGITIEGADANGETTANTINFKATFSGTITAQYTKKNVLYFNNTLGWDSVFVYFYKDGYYWSDYKNGSGSTEEYVEGSGAKTGMHSSSYTGNFDKMTRIEGTNIWYFDYQAAGIDRKNYITFTKDRQNGYDYFHSTEVVRLADAAHYYDKPASLPMYVPLTTKSEIRNKTAENAFTKYYTEGYWMNYPENTGYTLHIYETNSYGTSDEIRSIPFKFSTDKAMPMSITVELNANREYGFEIHRVDGTSYGNSSTMKINASGDFELSQPVWEFTTGKRAGIKTSAAGEYTFTLKYGEKPNDNYYYLVGVHYPVSVGSYRLVYTDNNTNLWSGNAKPSGWYHPSRVIYKNDGAADTVSFFVSKGSSPQIQIQKITTIDGEGNITWENVGSAVSYDGVSAAGVYNFITSQTADALTIDKVEPYTGNYYIRTEAVDEKWFNYRTGTDHQMTYSSFSESDANSFGEKYSHYKAKWCPRNTNIAFCIANDYSPCITDTLKQDVGNPYSNTNAEGTLYNDGDNNHSGSQAYLDRFSANVRFMWNRKTNKISRAYVSAATSSNAKFLVLQGNEELKNEAGDATVSDGGITNGVLFSDKENWIYERTLQIKPGTLFKVYACYANESPTEANAQYFRGKYADNAWDAANTVVLIGGTGDYQKARIVYDFKTNRLIAAWMPSGNAIVGDIDINADVMVIRDHQDAAQCITFADDDAKLSDVKTVYGVMRFNRWILNNRQYPENQNKNEADLEHHPPLAVGSQKSFYERSLYFISFPFDVRVSDIFGFGQYWSHWVIQYYDGLNRAKNGYWLDSESNWKYISPSEVAQGYTLKANEGYLLNININAMAADNTSFWSNGISTVELYFPSTVDQNTLKQTDITIDQLSDEYKCTINRGDGTEGDRRVKDSYWRCIGVPSYNLYNSTLKDGSGVDISWKNNYTWAADESEFPFIYMWNKADNTLTPQATSNFTFQPMHAYLTQIKSGIVWEAVSAKPSPIVARRARKEADNEHEWRIELRQDSTFLDQTYVRMTDMEQVTDSFDFGQDLVKELNSRSNLYTYIGYEKVAGNSMPLNREQTTVIPVGLNIRADGEYTFAMPDGTSGVGVTLVDTEANVRTSLSALDYTVELSAGEYTNRFFLEISPIQNTPTDLGNVQGNNVQGTKARKVMVDGILYIVKDGKMYDARGKLVR